MATKRSLEQFRKDRKRATCPICKLPNDIRGQINEAKAQSIPRREVIEWLKEDHGTALTDADFTRHISGKHEA